MIDSINEGESAEECVARHSFVISNKFIEIDPDNSFPYWLRAEAKENKGYPSFLIDYLRSCDLGEKEACKEYKKRKNMQMYNVVDSIKFSHYDMKLDLNCWNITITPAKKFIIFLFLDENSEQYASVYHYKSWKKLLGPFKINKAGAMIYTENFSEKIYFMSMKKGVILNVNTLKLENSEVKFAKLVELEKTAGKNFNGKNNISNSKKPEIRIDNNLIIAGSDYFSIWEN